MAPAALPTHTAKKGAVTLHVQPSRAAPGGAVAVGVPIQLNAHLLRALQCGNLGGTHGVPSAAAADVTIVAYAAFLKIQAKLAADPKAGAPCCAAVGNEFVVSVACDKTMSSARKTAAAILGSLRFGSLSGAYRDLARGLGIAPDKAAYAHAAHALRAAVLKGVTVVVAGRINVPRAEIAKKAADTLAAKVVAASAKTVPAGKARSGAAFEVLHGDVADSCAAPSFVEFKASGLKAALLCQYLQSRGIAAVVAGSGVLVDSHHARAASTNAKVGAAAYIKKWKSGGRGLLVYQAAVNCMAATDALKVTGDAPAAAWITAALP